MGGQGVAPGGHDAVFKSVEELSGPVEVGEFEVADAELASEHVGQGDVPVILGDHWPGRVCLPWCFG